MPTHEPVVDVGVITYVTVVAVVIPAANVSVSIIGLVVPEPVVGVILVTSALVQL